MTNRQPKRIRVAIFVSWLLLIVQPQIGRVEVLLADGPADNNAATVRPIPPPGIDIPEATRSALLERTASIRQQLQELQLEPASESLISVFPRAVEMVVEQHQFYSDKEIGQAQELLALADQRLIEARHGKRKAALLNIKNPAPSDKPQLLVGGYRSRIDGSVQPYGIVLPTDYRGGQPLRLDVWLHGRGEKSSEVAFLHQRTLQAGEFTPPNTLVLHPYGRYCNAFKFAGEIDILEAIEHVKQLFNIDAQRMTMRGFSMGGAGCWQMAVHYPQLWVAANPGAGFSETMEFLSVFQKERFEPTDYQKKLLHWYDCPDWTNNLRHVPTVAYSGEVDNQKQAADVMEAAYRSRGMTLPHVIGPQAGHKILPESKPLIQQQLDVAIDAGKPLFPKTIDLTTYMLRYHQQGWLSIEGLEKHWEESIVHAELSDTRLLLQTKNISKLKFEFADKDVPGIEVRREGANIRTLSVEADSQHLTLSLTRLADGVWQSWLCKDSAGLWTSDCTGETTGLVKRPGLSGPIDDAFMDAFLWVGPSATAADSDWYTREFQHATQQWRKHFRGDIVAKAAEAVTEDDLAKHNLILFGTPATNELINRVLPKLPVQWDASTLKLAGIEVSSKTHAPVLIYPNPLNPQRYVVLNSGFTFREYAYLNNARQIAMLPDWAVVDFSTGATTQHPGKVIAGGFFDEQWR